MKAFASGKLNNFVRYTIITLFIPFVGFRTMIGYKRMERGYLNDREIRQYHGFAFGVMAIADLICTCAILYFVKQINNKANTAANLNQYVKHSSYTILVWVDIVSLILSILNIINNMSETKGELLSALAVPFHCFKSSFVLILAIDALLFKYSAKIGAAFSASDSKNDSSNETKVGQYNKSISFNYGNIDNTKKTIENSFYGTTHAIEMNDMNSNKMSDINTVKMSDISSNKTVTTVSPPPKLKKSNVSDIAPYSYSYPPMEKDLVYPGGVSSSSLFSSSQNIINNYNGIQVPKGNQKYTKNYYGYLNSQQQKYQY